jgi:hypothetical protein
MLRRPLLGLLICLLTGCGARDTCYPVVGSVFFQGQPLSGGLIVFTPDEERGNSGPVARAIIDSDGKFVLTTQISNGSVGEIKNGAVRGWHTITIAPPVGSNLSSYYSAYPQRFRNPKISGLGWEVSPSQVNDMDINVKP